MSRPSSEPVTGTRSSLFTARNSYSHEHQCFATHKFQLYDHSQYVRAPKTRLSQNHCARPGLARGDESRDPLGPVPYPFVNHYSRRWSILTDSFTPTQPTVIPYALARKLLYRRWMRTRYAFLTNPCKMWAWFDGTVERR